MRAWSPLEGHRANRQTPCARGCCPVLIEHRSGRRPRAAPWAASCRSSRHMQPAHRKVSSALATRRSVTPLARWPCSRPMLQPSKACRQSSGQGADRVLTPCRLLGSHSLLQPRPQGPSTASSKMMAVCAARATRLSRRSAAAGNHRRSARGTPRSSVTSGCGKSSFRIGPRTVHARGGALPPVLAHIFIRVAVCLASAECAAWVTMAAEDPALAVPSCGGLLQPHLPPDLLQALCATRSWSP